MENKVISETDLNPRVILDYSGVLAISGKSRMEDASLFYKEIVDWVNNFISQKSQALTVKIKLSYFNSSSAKQLLKILMLVDDSPASGKVKWFYPKGNDILLERGQELEIMLGLPFEYIEQDASVQEHDF